MLDLVLRNAIVVDGTGRPRFRADIGIKNGVIAAVENLPDAESEASLDVSGMCVSPGFVDMHSHSDLSLLAHRKGEGALSQGITTEVVGNCGWSMAPVKEETKNSVLRHLLSGLVHRCVFERIDWTWHSLGEFMDKMDKTGIGTNVAPQVGQSLLRAHVVGTEKREATPGEIEAMKCMLREAMEAGAWGMSTGRSYVPGRFAPTSEITELARVVNEYDGIYATHMKNEGDALFESVDEVISIVAKTGVRAEISHHKVLAKRNFGKVARSLEMIQEARQRGLRITVDVYPYEFSQASSMMGFLPPEALRRIHGGGKRVSLVDERDVETIRRRLGQNDVVAEVKELPDIGAFTKRIVDSVIVRAPSFPDAEGRILGEHAKELKADVIDVFAHLVHADGLGVWSASAISMDDVRTIIKACFSMPGTDGFTLDDPIDPTPIHPRHHGTFPRVIGRFVREGVLTLEEAVRKSTLLPAITMGFRDRGQILPGYWADLVVFDPDVLEDTATATQPYLRAKGIHYVLVNGKVAFENGCVKPVFAGRVLRKKT